MLYSPYLCAKYDAHINVEACALVKSVKYICKYVYKGHDRTIVEITSNTNHQNDEVLQYPDCRYITGPEACWTAGV